jgi:hypothetical protein
LNSQGGTESQNGRKERQAKTDARKKRTKGKNKRKWTQGKNGGKQQSGALIGVKGKKPTIEAFLEVEVSGFKVWARCTHCI